MHDIQKKQRLQYISLASMLFLEYFILCGDHYYFPIASHLVLVITFTTSQIACFLSQV